MKLIILMMKLKLFIGEKKYIAADIKCTLKKNNNKKRRRRFMKYNLFCI